MDEIEDGDYVLVTKESCWCYKECKGTVFRVVQHGLLVRDIKITHNNSGLRYFNYFVDPYDVSPTNHK